MPTGNAASLVTLMARRDGAIAGLAAASALDADEARRRGAVLGSGWSRDETGLIRGGLGHAGLRATIGLEIRRLTALLLAAIQSVRPRQDDDGEIAEVFDATAEAAPPPASAFTLAIVTSPILPAAPPRLGALV